MTTANQELPMNPATPDPISILVSFIQAVLTPDLVHRQYRDVPGRLFEKCCYPMTEAFFHLAGGRTVGVPCQGFETDRVDLGVWQLIRSSRGWGVGAILAPPLRRHAWMVGPAPLLA